MRLSSDSLQMVSQVNTCKLQCWRISNGCQVQDFFPFLVILPCWVGTVFQPYLVCHIQQLSFSFQHMFIPWFLQSLKFWVSNRKIIHCSQTDFLIENLKMDQDSFTGPCGGGALGTCPTSTCTEPKGETKMLCCIVSWLVAFQCTYKSVYKT